MALQQQTAPHFHLPAPDPAIHSAAERISAAEPMNAIGRPSLNLLTLNVNGLGTARKRLTLFSMLLSGHWDIVVLQETHHESSEQG